MNGAELAREVRRRRPEQRIVFVTGFADSEQLGAAVGPGAAVLRKPFVMRRLTASLEN